MNDGLVLDSPFDRVNDDIGVDVYPFAKLGRHLSHAFRSRRRKASVSCGVLKEPLPEPNSDK